MTYSNDLAGRLNRVILPRDFVHAYFIVLVFGAFYFITVVAGGSPLRLVIYSLPFVSIFFSLILSSDRRLVWDQRFLIAALVYLTLSFFASSLTLSFHFEAIRDILIIGGSFLIFLPFFRVNEAAVRVLTLVLLVSFAFMAMRGGAGSLSVDFVGSEGFLEGPLAWPFGILSYYFLKRRQWSWFALCLVVFVLSFKRIALLAFVIVVAIDYTLSIMYSSRERRMRMASLVALAMTAFCAVLALNINEVARYLLDLLDIKGAINAVTMGRYLINAEIDAFLEQQTAWQWIFGNGAGFADAFVSELTAGKTANLHNDFRKLLLDYGYLGLVVIPLLFFYVFQRTPETLMIWIFNALLFISDNTLIYLYHSFTCFIVMRAFCDHALADEDGARAVRGPRDG